MIVVCDFCTGLAMSVPVSMRWLGWCNVGVAVVGCFHVDILVCVDFLRVGLVRDRRVGLVVGVCVVADVIPMYARRVFASWLFCVVVRYCR